MTSIKYQKRRKEVMGLQRFGGVMLLGNVKKYNVPKILG